VGAVISSITLKKVKGAISMVNSDIAASRINRLSLGIVQFSNSGATFGAEANSIGSLSAADSSTGQSFTFTKLTSAAVVAADLTNKGVMPQDFEIRIV